MNDWKIRVDGEDLPITLASLRARVRSGNVSPLDLVFRPSAARWLQVNEVPELVHELPRRNVSKRDMLIASVGFTIIAVFFFALLQAPPPATARRQDTPTRVDEYQIAATLARSSLIILDLSGDNSYGYMTIRGRVHNRSRMAFDRVKVEAIVTDEYTNVIARDWTYVTHGRMEPGDSLGFEIIEKVPPGPAPKSFTARVIHEDVVMTLPAATAK